MTAREGVLDTCGAPKGACPNGCGASGDALIGHEIGGPMCGGLVPYYDDGLTTIYHGDSRDILPRIGRFDLMLTDPPYGIAYVSNSGAGKGTKPITNDGTRLSLRLYRELIPTIEADHVLWFTRWDAWPDVWVELGQSFPLRGLLVWDKGTPGMGDLSHWGLNYELIASAGSGKLVGGRDSSILRFNGVSPSSRIHPTEKPVPLLRYLIEKMGANTVVDPFMGSGTTLEAARQLGVRSVGIETDIGYCAAAAARFTQAVIA